MVVRSWSLRDCVLDEFLATPMGMGTGRTAGITETHFPACSLIFARRSRSLRVSPSVNSLPLRPLLQTRQVRHADLLHRKARDNAGMGEGTRGSMG
uniref:Uncharacterized protein n=1 Tax=Mycena chlorophos TaxID=658473 RepID=A0ABQ0L6J0_MYCCL|nr:predicted protein [Mycena chlorophos]